MRALSLASCVLVAACSPWPAPSDSPRWPAPTGLGTFIVEGAPLRATTLDFTAKSSRVYVLQTLGPGYAVDLTRVTATTSTLLELDLASGRVTTLPPPPAEVKGLWPSDEPTGFLATTATGVLSFDGATWAELPSLPAGRLTMLYRADASRVFAHVSNTVLVLRDGQWRDLTTSLPQRATAQVALGPWSDGVVRLLWTEPGATQSQACTQVVDTTTLALLEAPVCKDALGFPNFAGDAFNGTVDDFQVAFTVTTGANLLVWRYAAGAWSRGALVGASAVRATPGARDLCVDGPATAGRLDALPVMRVSGGQPVQTLFMPSFSLLGCSGDQRTCARGVDLLVQGVNRDCTAALFLIDNEVDATRKVYLKKVDLPARDQASCAPACPSGQLCVADGTAAGTCVLDPSANATGTSMPASLVFRTELSSGVPFAAPLTFTDPATGAPLDGFTAALEQGTQRTIVTGPPGRQVTLGLDVAGHVSRRVTVTMPNENTRADLGTLSLVRGVRLGSSPIGLTTSRLATVVVGDAGASLALPLLGDDGGVAMTQVLDAADGGLELRVLAATDPSATVPVASPDGRWLLWGDARGLQVLELASLRRGSVPNPTDGGWGVGLAVFSGDGTAVAVPHASAVMGLEVVELSASPTVRFSVGEEGGATAQLSQSGDLVLQQFLGQWRLGSAAGSFTATSAPAAALSGDGTRLYSATGSLGNWTLWVQPTTSGASATQVATGLSAWTADAVGNDALYATIASGRTSVFRVAGATGAVTPVQASITGQAEALPRGALWVRDTTSTRAFFPVSASSGRTVSGNHHFFLDDQGRLLSVLGQLLWDGGQLRLPPGPGVFTADSSRRLVPFSRSVATLSGVDEVSVRSYASPNLAVPPVVDERFTNQAGRQSYFAPCAVFSHALTGYRIAASGGAVTTVTEGVEVVCVR